MPNIWVKGHCGQKLLSRPAHTHWTNYSVWTTKKESKEKVGKIIIIIIIIRFVKRQNVKRLPWR